MSCDENCNGDCEHNHDQIGVEEISRHNNFLISVLIKTLMTKGVITDEDMNNTVKEFQESAQAESDDEDLETEDSSEVSDEKAE